MTATACCTGPRPSCSANLAQARADGSLGRLLESIARTDVLLVDDFAMAALSDEERRSFLEVCDDRYGRRSTVLTSQLKCGELHFNCNAEIIFMRAPIAESPDFPLFWLLLSPHKSWGGQESDQLVAGTKAA